MLEMRPSCECCDIALPPGAEALICSFECTFCPDCATALGKCPNCGGGLVPRPTRAAEKLARFPASTARVFNPDCKGLLSQPPSLATSD
ncbi:DUF1272 domain-containing protein [Paracoccus pacificus]|uniref:DUF1272 domain-containing protein n=1 Tax=Paracoccus pacificus TaxID=1463598 RepID=A0ABW4R6B7_9RHOB